MHVKRKNDLYQRFLCSRSKTDEVKYKSYKNKLTSILKRSEKQYYNQLLESHKTDIKSMWKILNSIIKKTETSSKYPDVFISNGNYVNSKQDIENGFNDFFCRIGVHH